MPSELASNATPIADLLIVDDTLNNLKLLSDMLTNAGFYVRKATGGEMAIAAVSTKLPDLILLDVNMPKMNGYEVCCELKANPETESIPIIFLSALDAAFDKVRAFDLGAADYITKPFHQEEVLKRIQNQLRIRTLNLQLEKQNKILENALKYFQQNQAEIIQHGRMQGLSQIVAGVAHEINNPIGFISGNIGHAQDYFEQLQAIIETHYKTYPDLAFPAERENIEFIFEDFPKLIQSMRSGATRICQIVQSLQGFSHHGEEGLRPMELHATLESILKLLQPRLQGKGKRPEIKVSLHLENLPPITCNIQLIGQVFYHILNNAIDAIDEWWDLYLDQKIPLGQRQPKIEINAQCVDDQWIWITIDDNGIGIQESIQSRIFEPFFSTKKIGHGSGLGLYISYQIITEKHQGKLICQSKYLEGSTFRVQIPLMLHEAPSVLPGLA